MDIENKIKNMMRTVVSIKEQLESISQEFDATGRWRESDVKAKRLGDIQGNRQKLIEILDGIETKLNLT